MSANGLSPQQSLFCEYYAAGYPAYKAAILAGYSRVSARSQSSDMLGIVGIREYLEKLRNNTKEALGLEAKNVARGLMDIAYTELPDVTKWDGKKLELLPPEEWPIEARAGVKKATVVERITENHKAGTTTTTTTTVIELESKIAAFDSLAKMLGLYQGFDTLVTGLEAYGLKVWQDDQGEWKVEKIQR
jgi:phage terminase small subunit